ncbi:kinase-like domain-containing protein, partial [Suillus clintonianus]|uniref:kinase-like domain-containing protein n=1 Tax=Suillus clintonianus TaxID=1904413 RepID=UPI001B86341E
RYRDKVETWAILAHENIVLLLGTTDGFGPYTALVFPWFPDGTLLRLIADQGARLNIRSRLNLLHGIASGLEYLHRSGIIHGDITSSNILVDFKEGEYQACLTDIGLATVLGGRLGNRMIEGSNVRSGAIRWIAPDLLTAGGSPTMQNDMYSFGRVMFHVSLKFASPYPLCDVITYVQAFALVIPWHDVHYDFSVLQRILNGDVISRPVTPDATDITDARWNEIEKCWSAAGSRPS